MPQTKPKHSRGEQCHRNPVRTQPEHVARTTSAPWTINRWAQYAPGALNIRIARETENASAEPTDAQRCLSNAILGSMAAPITKKSNTERHEMSLQTHFHINLGQKPPKFCND